MKKFIRLFVGAFLFFAFIIQVKAFTCSIGKFEVEFNNNGEMVSVYQNGNKTSFKMGSSTVKPKSKSECPSNDEVEEDIVSNNGQQSFNIIVNTAVTRKKVQAYASGTCTSLGEENCKKGITEVSGKQIRIGCAWNEEYKFCSPTGLSYIACGSGDAAAYDIPPIIPKLTSYAITILKTVTPVILIFIAIIQLIKAISSQSDDEMNKAKKSLIKKLIIAALIFFVVTIVQFIVNKVADDSEAQSVRDCMNCFINNSCTQSTYYSDGYGNCYSVSNNSALSSCPGGSKYYEKQASDYEDIETYEAKGYSPGTNKGNNTGNTTSSSNSN